MALLRTSLILGMFFASWQTIAQKTFDFNENCRSAYQQITMLKLDPGQAILNEERKQHPDNLIPYLLENYIEFFRLFFNEEPELYAGLSKRVGQRLDRIEEGPHDSPYYLFSKSVINFQSAAVRIKAGGQWEGGWQFRRAYADIRKNQQAFPAFGPNLMFSGSMKAAVSVIPDGLKWLGNILGVKGNMDEGIADLEKFLTLRDDQSLLFRNEAIFYYVLLRYYLRNDKEAIFEFIRAQQPDVKNNHLFTFMTANLHINNQQSAVTESIIKGRNMSPEYLTTPVWDLELGYARLNHLDDDAPFYFKRFLAAFKGDYYVKDVLQKLSWHYYIHDDMKQAEYYRSLMRKRKGENSEADQLAAKDAERSQWPDKLLLKVRLLNDGGYYHEALGLLHGKRAADFPDPRLQLEFLYRVARLFNDLNREEHAMTYFRQVVAAGRNRKEHYAARAALQLGMIYEQRKDCKSAIAWFNTCLHMKDHDFKNSLDQRAKAGINRCR